MNKLLLSGACAASLALPSLSFAHGGTYRGPSDTVPPSGGGGGGGGGPSTPSSPAGPGQPGAPGRPGAGPTTPGSPAASPGKPSPATGDQGGDLTGWEYWWAFNKDPFLALRARLAAGGVQTGSDQYYLGRDGLGSGHDTLRVSDARIRSQIVPELLAALAHEKSNDIQSSCMVALAKIGEVKTEDGTAPIAEAIRPFLTSSSQELSETAAIALGILASADNVPWLTAVLENDLSRLRALGLPVTERFSQRTRAFSAYGLGLIAFRANEDERRTIVETLQRFLDGEGRSQAQRDIPVACLNAMGLAALPLAPGATDALEFGRGRGPRSIVWLQDQLAYLGGYFADASNNYLTRAHVPTAMARLIAASDVPDASALRRSVVEQFMAALDDGSTQPDAVQQSCAIALGMIGDSDEDPTDKALRAALMRASTRSGDQQTGRFASIALGQAAGRPGRGAGDPVYGVDAKEKRDNARTFLLGQLVHEKNAAQSWAGLSLAVLERGLADAKQSSSPESKLVLQTALADAGSPSTIGALSIACGLVPCNNAGAELLRKLEQCNDPEARGYVAVGLGLMNETSALRPIQELVRKAKYQPDLMKSASIALGLLGDHQIVDELVEMLGSATSLYHQGALSSALGFIGDSRSVDPLVSMLKNGSGQHTDLARAFAAVALGLIADKESLPWNSKFAVNSNYRANTPTLTDQRGGILDIL